MSKPQFAELVFGFVYPAGTDADPVIAVFKDYLTQYRYSTTEYRVSEELRHLELGISFDALSTVDTMHRLMDAGNAACQNDSRTLAALAVHSIASKREEDEHGRLKPRDRTAHLIRSLKRPEEVFLLREIYRPVFS